MEAKGKSSPFSAIAMIGTSRRLIQELTRACLTVAKDYDTSMSIDTLKLRFDVFSYDQARIIEGFTKSSCPRRRLSSSQRR